MRAAEGGAARRVRCVRCAALRRARRERAQPDVGRVAASAPRLWQHQRLPGLWEVADANS
eukprot:4684834-Prymnesium_polylepis.1